MPNRTPSDPAIYLTANPDPDPDPDFTITLDVKVLHFFFPFFLITVFFLMLFKNKLKMQFLKPNRWYPYPGDANRCGSGTQYLYEATFMLCSFPFMICAPKTVFGSATQVKKCTLAHSLFK